MVQTPIRVLVPFHGDWELETLRALNRDGQIELHLAGFDVRRPLGGLQLLAFDPARSVERLARRWRGRIDAVWSCEEQFGCLMAAVLADRLGLPASPPEAVVRAQHKLWMRQILAASMPEASVPAIALSVPSDRHFDARAAADAIDRAALQWPLWAKPVKGTYSIMARRLESITDLADHVKVSRFDRFVMRRLTAPFEALATMFAPLPCDADSLLIEDMMHGHQVNVDGYAFDGELRVIGVVDEWMYAEQSGHARHFAGFTYPSCMPPDMRNRVEQVALSAVRAIGFDQGQFNVELFVDAQRGVRIIEINPRAAGQFATLYRDVDGLQLELMGIWLAAGRDPQDLPRLEPRARVAGSLVYRRFDRHSGAEARADGLAWLDHNHPGARLWRQPTGRREVKREYRWLGSHRYAILNCAADDHDGLRHLGEECGRRLFGVAGPPLYESGVERCQARGAAPGSTARPAG